MSVVDTQILQKTTAEGRVWKDDMTMIGDQSPERVLELIDATRKKASKFGLTFRVVKVLHYEETKEGGQ
jgi:hypothetical protein